jgi:hypothetical protein
MPSSQEPIDRAAIIERVHRYFRCLDERNAEALAACLAADVTARHTLFGELRGREAFLQVALARWPGLVSAQHYCSNEEVDVAGDRAGCRAYLYAQHVVLHEGSHVLMPGGGRYTFELGRTGDAWIIRTLANDVTWMDPGLAAVFAPTR